MVHRVTDALLQLTHQTRDDAVARERLLLQQQQISQRDFIEKEMRDKELLLAEKEKEKEVALKEKQIQLKKEMRNKKLLLAK